MARPRDSAGVIELAGPWQHRHVAANGARFHVAEMPDAAPEAPLVLLLHGFPEFWWAWRAQLPALSAAGFRAVAMDLRGYGGSDKTPRGYDPFTLAQDVSGVVKALGERSAVLVGHGWGGYVAWATAVLQPAEVSALCPVSAPHPLEILTGRRAGATALRHVLAMQVPRRPERRLADGSSGFLAGHLAAWSSPGTSFPDAPTVATYQAALSLWPAPHCAVEYHRWLFRSRFRADGRRFGRLMHQPVTQPVHCLAGAQDPVLTGSWLPASRRRVAGRFSADLVPGTGHFPHEERPDAFNDRLLAWLATV